MMAVASRPVSGGRPQRFRSLFPPGVAFAASDPRLDHPAVDDLSAQMSRRFSERRRREFLAGRAAIRQAIADLGEAPRPVAVGPDRAPVWPRGLAGSLSHSATFCVAAVARTDQFRALGVDVEEDMPLDPALEDTILTASERDRLPSEPGRRGRTAKLVFSAKECAYKCQYALSRKLFDFHTLDLWLDQEARAFSATFLRDVAPFGRGAVLRGRFMIEDGIIATWMGVPA